MSALTVEWTRMDMPDHVRLSRNLAVLSGAAVGLHPANHSPTLTECSHTAARSSPWGSSSCTDRHSCTAGTTGSTAAAAAAKLRLLPERRTVETGVSISASHRSRWDYSPKRAGLQCSVSTGREQTPYSETRHLKDGSLCP